MFAKGLRVAVVLLGCAAISVSTGCSMCKGSVTRTVSHDFKTGCAKTTTTTMASTQVIPNATVGECYAHVWVPPQFQTVSERIMVKDAAERIEVVPAQYAWAEEKVLVKEASTQLEYVPAEFEWQERTVEVNPGGTGWMKEESTKCKTVNGQPVGEVFCLVKHPPQVKTVRTQVMTKPATTREVCLPAEYETRRFQKLTNPATTRKISIPAEFEDVTKTVQVSGGKLEWQRVICQIDTTTDRVNAIKGALATAGYKPGPTHGEFDEQDWEALKKYQYDNRLGVGALSYQTLDRLGVEVDK